MARGNRIGGPESLDAHAKLGLLREGLGNWGGARAAFGAFLARCPTGPRADAVREHVARCEAALGRR